VSRVESAAADAINASDDGDDDDVDGDNDKLMNNRHLLISRSRRGKYLLKLIAYLSVL